MFDLFSDIFTYRDNLLTRIDPRAKLLIALAALLAVVTARGALLPLGILGLSLGTVATLKVPLRLVAARLAAPLAIVTVLIALKTFLTGEVPLGSLEVAGWTLTARAEGLREGLLIAARVLGAVSVLLLTGIVTPAHRIFQALRWLRISKDWLEVAILMYRYIFVLLDRVAALAAAQRLRLGYRQRGRALESLSTLAGATLVHSFEQARRTHAAMRLRGYSGAMPFGPLPSLALRDRLILALGLAVIAAARLAEWGVGR